MKINKLTTILDNYQFLDDNEDYHQHHNILINRSRSLKYEKDTIIIYSYCNDNMLETRAQLKEYNIKYDEHIDEFDQSYLLIQPTLNNITNY